MRHSARFRSSALGILGGLGGLVISSALLATAVAAADPAPTFAVGVDACENGTTQQLCTPVSTVSVTTDGPLQVEFSASPNHCSSVIAHVLVDGVERYVSGALAAGQSTGVQDLGPVAPGTHAIGVQAEGVVGGCNAGALLNWAGTLKVGVLAAPAANPTPTPVTPSPTPGPSPTPAPLAATGSTGADYTPLLFGILAAGLLLAAGAYAAYQVRKPRFQVDPLTSHPGDPIAPADTVAIPPDPVAPAQLAAPPDPITPIDPTASPGDPIIPPNPIVPPDSV
jgi:hypothetical protein